MDCEKREAMLRRLQEMEFVAVELNLYLDTHPCDEDALNDFNCAVQALREYKEAYEEEFGPLLNFGHGGFAKDTPWQWLDSPWPWEM